jgi:UDP-2-acetamido-2-deoxy-ribo-hexuluronate aminotransferase
MISLFELGGYLREERNGLHAAFDELLNSSEFVLGDNVSRLEFELAQYVGVDHCIAVSSGTDALLMSLMAIGLQAGDEVITTSFSFISTVEVISRAGATPVFADCNFANGNLSVESVLRQITPKTKAILAVNLFGLPFDFPGLRVELKMLGRSDIILIEDGAQSFGSTLAGAKACSLGDLGCTSFFPTKALGGLGDGGAVFTSDASWASAVKSIRSHGRSESSRYHYERLGLCGRLDEIQAAFLSLRLKNFPNHLRKRHKIGSLYDEIFASAGIKTNEARNLDHNTNYGLYTLYLDNRDHVKQQCHIENIQTQVYYPALLHENGFLRGIVNNETLSNAYHHSKTCLSIPMHPFLSESDVEKIARILIRENIENENNFSIK